MAIFHTGHGADPAAAPIGQASERYYLANNRVFVVLPAFLP